jgi:hypothetical protein
VLREQSDIVRYVVAGKDFAVAATRLENVVMVQLLGALVEGTTKVPVEPCGWRVSHHLPGSAVNMMGWCLRCESFALLA